MRGIQLLLLLLLCALLSMAAVVCWVVDVMIVALRYCLFVLCACLVSCGGARGLSCWFNDCI